MLSKSFLFLLINIIQWANCSRVIYMVMHAEKPNYGVLDKGSKWSTTQNMPDCSPDDGLGITGVERSKCLVNVFGRTAPIYRQPKEILYQHYTKQGNFIDSGTRGKHESRRMYQTAQYLAEDLGINLDNQLCCGGEPDDMFNYIESLDESINPVFVVHQHQQVYKIVKKMASKYGKKFPYSEFEYNSSIIWTVVEGEVVEEWNMGCSFDTPKKKDRLMDPAELELLIKGNSNLEQTQGGNSTLVMDVVPLVTTKVVPASLLTTYATKSIPDRATATVPDAIVTDTISTTTATIDGNQAENTISPDSPDVIAPEVIPPEITPDTTQDIISEVTPDISIDMPPKAIQDTIQGEVPVIPEGLPPKKPTQTTAVPNNNVPVPMTTTESVAAPTSTTNNNNNKPTFNNPFWWGWNWVSWPNNQNNQNNQNHNQQNNFQNPNQQNANDQNIFSFWNTIIPKLFKFSFKQK